MSDQPHYPYRDGDRAVLGPDVTATADGMTIRWKGANYRRDHGEHVGAATPLICSDERHAAKVAALQADLDRYEEVLGDLNETLVDRAKQAARAEAERDQIREDLGAALGRADADRASLTEVRMRERARQAAIERVRDLHRKASHGETCVYCAHGQRLGYDTTWPCDTIRALDGVPSAPAATRYIHATITNRDEYTANRAALSLVDWIHAEFPGLHVTTDAREWTAPAARDQIPWCCTGPGYVAECPLCPGYGTSLLDPCPGHDLTEDNRRTVDTARLHAERRHPGYEYATTTGPRKQWDNPDEPPSDDNGDPDPSWEPNVDAGRPGQGWERFDYHEEAYWRRPKQQPEPAPAATQATEPATVTDPEWLHRLYADAAEQVVRDGDGGWTYDEMAAAVLRVRDRHLQQLRQRLRLADELLATRDAELAAAKKTARGIGAWGVLQAIEQALPNGPTVREAAADDLRWPLEKHGE